MEKQLLYGEKDNRVDVIDTCNIVLIDVLAGALLHVVVVCCAGIRRQGSQCVSDVSFQKKSSV